MEDTRISEKIEALKLELARKQRKLMKINKCAQLQKLSVKGHLESPIRFSGAKSPSTKIPSSSIVSYTKAVTSAKDRESLNGVTVPNVRNPSSPCVPSSKVTLSAKYGPNLPPPPLFSEPKQETNCDISTNSGEEELFPDDNQEASEIKDYTENCFDINVSLQEKAVFSKTNEKERLSDKNTDSQENDVCIVGGTEILFHSNTSSEEKLVCKPDTESNIASCNINYNFQTVVRSSSNSGLGLPFQTTSDCVDMKKVRTAFMENVTCNTDFRTPVERRRSSRISSKSMGDTSSKRKNKKMKLDIQSVIGVTFEILCEMGQNLPEEDFSLPGNDFSMPGLETRSPVVTINEVEIQEDVISKMESNDCVNEQQLKETYDTCFSENVVPPTFDFGNKSFSSNLEVMLKKTELSFHTTNSTVNITKQKCSTDLFDNCEEVPEDKFNLKNRVMEMIEKEPGVEIQRLDQIDENSQEINHICESVLKEMMNMLDVSTTEGASELQNRDNPSDENGENFRLKGFSFHAAHCLQGPSSEPVERISLALQNSTLFAFIQKRQSLSVWKEHHGRWLPTHIYEVKKTEEILDMTIFDSSFAVLVKAFDFVIRVLALVDQEVSMQCEITLGKQSRGAISGVLGNLHEESTITSCLEFENQCSQVELHTLRSDQSTNTIYLEPPGESILGPVVSILGLPNALLAVASQKLFFWNISTGLLVRTVMLSHEKDKISFEKCIWTKFEKGLLFGVFKEVSSGNWSLFVINPASGLHNELCQYICPICQEESNENHPKSKLLQGRVECHKLLSICYRNHLTIFDLLSGSPLIISKAEDTKTASLNANVLITADYSGSVNAFSIPCKR